MLTIHDFVENIENKSSFELDELVAVGKRLNNPKRDYLFINKLMGKHIPVDPLIAHKLFDKLSYEVIKKVVGKKVLVIGFSETATAIAQSVMFNLVYNHGVVTPVYYAQTTREDLPLKEGVHCINFEEEHSHASAQKLYIHNELPEHDIILFVEDEITTGKTILNTIEKLNLSSEYIVASILNWQNEDSKAMFKENGIETVSLVSGTLKTDIPTIDIIDDESAVTKVDFTTPKASFVPVDIRIGKTTLSWIKYQEIFLRRLQMKDDDYDAIIGTEEFMYIPMCYALEHGKTFRATTRSPITVDGEVITSRLELPSVYDSSRQTYLYNVDPTQKTLLMSDVVIDNEFTNLGWDTMDMVLKRKVRSSYSPDDVDVLLQDVSGRVPVLDTLEREKLNQSGVHYSEMLPVEYEPSKAYMDIYDQSVVELSKETAKAVELLAKKIYARHGRNTVLVSLARAGTPVGILLKRYFQQEYGFNPPHYTISIIRGKGIDKYAMKYILTDHKAEDIQFVDGWVGKGAINLVLNEAIVDFPGIDPELAVLSDPASVTSLYGTRQDFLIPSACLNSTVSGLFSRTVKTADMTDNEFHGAVYYKENEAVDVSYEFIDDVVSQFNNDFEFQPSQAELDEDYKGIDEVLEIAAQYEIDDYTKVKPGVGETTRVLLRRVPDRILVNPNANKKYLKHIYQLAKEKNVPIEEYAFKKYNVCGIIKDVTDL